MLCSPEDDARTGEEASRNRIISGTGITSQEALSSQAQQDTLSYSGGISGRSGCKLN